MDMNQYLDVFIDESKEHLQTCNEKLLLLEKDPTDLQLVHDIFRGCPYIKRNERNDGLHGFSTSYPSA